MSKISLTPLVNLQNETTAVTAINANNAVLTAAFDNTLSRDGTSPNQMNAVLDMNTNQIINLPAPSTVNSPARLVDVTTNPTIVVPGTGTSGHTVPFLDGNNTWSGTNTLGTENVTTLNVAGIASFTGTPVFPVNSISNASLGTMAANTAKGSIAGGTPADLTKTQLTTLINPVTSSLSGAAPASGGGTTNFLRADSTWTPPPAGNLVLLETLTASNSASLVSSVSWSGYSSIELVFLNLIPVTNNVSAQLLVHATSAYQTTGYLGISIVPNSTNIISLAPTTYIPLSNTSAVNTSGAGMQGSVCIFAPNTSNIHYCNGLVSYSLGAQISTIIVGGAWGTAATAVDGFQFLFSSGNIASGLIKVYGIV